MGAPPVRVWMVMRQNDMAGHKEVNMSNHVTLPHRSSRPWCLATLSKYILHEK